MNIYFTAELKKMDDYIDKLKDLFKDDKEFYEDIYSFEDERINFINIKLIKGNINQDEIHTISGRILNKLEIDQKIFLTTQDGTKYSCKQQTKYLSVVSRLN